ncbi:hypothetical protein [Neolewinella litorea]|uniref:Uncharacterized protein n=1 Tax=Neolewinella litorea TaxID=2562452 RepID=A0A4S4N8M5_9BACT|nr:hypothetical protein [Neolewinella litorea]THH35574.1 hypothetical protein E4021_15910 [Neolewinella litorea]
MRENPLPLLVLFLAVAALPSLAKAQLSPPAPATVTEVEYEDYAKLKRVRARLNHGPHRKNPLAAGRLRVINRTKAATTPARRPLPRTRGHRSNSTFTALHYERREAKARTTGPRYKNRRPTPSAAAGGEG